MFFFQKVVIANLWLFGYFLKPLLFEPNVCVPLHQLLSVTHTQYSTTIQLTYYVAFISGSNEDNNSTHHIPLGKQSERSTHNRPCGIECSHPSRRFHTECPQAHQGHHQWRPRQDFSLPQLHLRTHLHIKHHLLRMGSLEDHHSPSNPHPHPPFFPTYFILTVLLPPPPPPPSQLAMLGFPRSIYCSLSCYDRDRRTILSSSQR